MSSYNKWLHAYVILVVGCTALLIFAGSLVTTIGAGLAVPDWPLSFGSLNPSGWWRQPMVREEHGHRLLGATVGLLTLILCFALCRWQQDRHLRLLGICALCLVVIQGILGGLRVIDKNIYYAMIHACLAQLFFCLLIAIAWMTSSAWHDTSPGARGPISRRNSAMDRWLSLGVLLVVICQLVIGAIMRHSGAGLAISTFPTIDGGIFPRQWDQAVAIHFLHRLAGFGIAGLVVILYARSIQRYPRWASRSLAYTCALVMVQIGLGGAVILSGRALLPTTIHVLTGALILAGFWSSTLWLWKDFSDNDYSLESTNASAKPAVRFNSGMAVLITCLLAMHSSTAQAEIKNLAPEDYERFIAKVVADTIPRQHFLRQPINDDISQKAFARYFELLDPEKMYFLQSDLDRFAAYQKLLDNMVAQGNIDFAFDVYNLFLQRVNERLLYVDKLLSEELDFTTADRITIDRSTAQWCQTTTELEEIWRLEVKNDILARWIQDYLKSTTDPEDGINIPEDSPFALLDESDRHNPACVEEAGLETISMENLRQRSNKHFHHIVNELAETSSIDVLESFLNAISMVYDPHSIYMAPDTKENFDVTMKLSLFGIGARLTRNGGIASVEALVPGGPADLDERLEAGDRFVGVGQNLDDYTELIGLSLDKVVSLIRGPKDRCVYLYVLKNNAELGDDAVMIDLRRDKIKIDGKGANINYYQIPPASQPESAVVPVVPDALPTAPDNGSVAPQVGVIVLPSFYADFDERDAGVEDYKSSTRDVAELIRQAQEKKVSGLILDLRGNRGGSLDEAVSLAGLFLPPGPVVQICYARGNIRQLKCTEPQVFYDGALMVLVDRYSASASEIFAAAIQDYGRGIVIGDHCTHGKGTVQTVYSLINSIKNRQLLNNHDPGGIKLTSAKFYRINGASTQHRGMTPDVVLPSFNEYLEIGEGNLTNALPWDEIGTAEYQPDGRVTMLIPKLIKRSQERLAHDPEFAEHVAQVMAFGEWQNQKQLPLNRHERIEFERKERQMNDYVKNHGRKKPAKKARQTTDLILEESLRIMGDLTDVRIIPVSSAQTPSN